MAAFTFLDWTSFDFWAVVAGEGITVVALDQREACLESLRQHGYAIESIDFREGIGPAYATMNTLFQWEENFGYELRWHENRSLDALRDGFEFEVRPGGGTALEITGAEDAYREDSDFFTFLLYIAHESSLHHLALGARFFTILFLDPGSSLVGLQYRSLSVGFPTELDRLSPWP